MPVTANTGAILAVGLDLQEGKVIPRKQVISWALWDWATQPFNSVILTFVFTALYLTTDDVPAAGCRRARRRTTRVKVATLVGLTAASASRDRSRA